MTVAVISQIAPMPPELNWTLSTAPSASEALSLQQYVAGEYPHASGSAAAQVVAPSGPIAAPTDCVSQAPRVLPPAASKAGAEIFISALDSLVETLHRDRKRRDIMHPSVDDRVALLRTLTADPAAEERFNRSMRRTRMVIVGLLAGGIATAAVAALVDAKWHGPPASPAAKQLTQQAPAAAQNGVASPGTAPKIGN
jgi:hypothetical protein